MITKKYKYYTENGDKVSCHSNVNIFLATSLYDFYII